MATTKDKPRLFTDEEARDFEKMVKDSIGKRLNEACLQLEEYGLSLDPTSGYFHLVCLIRHSITGRQIKLASPFVEDNFDKFVDKTVAKTIEAFYSSKIVRV